MLRNLSTNLNIGLIPAYNFAHPWSSVVVMHIESFMQIWYVFLELKRNAFTQNLTKGCRDLTPIIQIITHTNYHQVWIRRGKPREKSHQEPLVWSGRDPGPLDKQYLISGHSFHLNPNKPWLQKMGMKSVIENDHTPTNKMADIKQGTFSKAFYSTINWFMSSWGSNWQ